MSQPLKLAHPVTQNLLSGGTTLAAGILAAQLWSPDGHHLLFLLPGVIASWLVLGGLRHLPGLIAGTLAIGLIAPSSAVDQRLWSQLAAGILSALFLRKARFDLHFRSNRNLGIFVLHGVLLPTVAGFLPSLLLLHPGLLIQPAEQTRALELLLANAAGIGLLLPAIVLIHAEWPLGRRDARFGLVLAVLLSAFSLFTVNLRIGAGDLPILIALLLLPFPLASYLVMRFGPASGMLCVLLAGLGVYSLTALGGGPFAGVERIDALVALHGTFTLLSVSTLWIVCVDADRARAQGIADAALRRARITYWSWDPLHGLHIGDPDWARALGTHPDRPLAAERVAALIHPDDTLPAFLPPETPRPIPPAPPTASTPPLPESPPRTPGGRCEFRIWHKDGDWRWVSCSPIAATDLRPPPGAVQHGLFQDIQNARASELTRRNAALREAELRSLKLRVQPHFLFNALNTLRSLISYNTELARDVVSHLAALLRSSLTDPLEDKVRLSRELETTCNYLAIEQARFGDKMSFVVTCPDTVRAAAFPPMLLQTLAENAVKYGVSRRSEPTCIRIEAELLGEARLRLRVENEGSIAKSAHQPGSLGSGLRTAADRLRLVFGETATLEVTDRETPAGTRVVATVELPLERP